MNGNVWLQELAWPEVARRVERLPVAILPVGATEAHGRRLPLGTDSFFSIRLAEDAARATGSLVAPPVWYGWSPHHMGFTGTVTLRPETLADVVTDVCASLAQHGLTTIFILNGHRVANLPPLQLGAWRVQESHGASITIVDLEYLAPDEYRRLEMGPIVHADDSETSLMLHLAPERVVAADEAGIAESKGRVDAGDEEPPGVVWFPPRAADAARFGASGGTPPNAAEATAAKGERLYGVFLERLVGVIRQATTEAGLEPLAERSTGQP